MNFGRIAQDPHFSGIMFKTESLIHNFDEKCKEHEINLTDTAVKSALRKILGLAKGKTPKFTENNEKEISIKELSLALHDLGSRLQSPSDVENEITKSDWITAIKAIEDSLKTRREMYGHSRGYLDFLKDFLTNGKTI